MTKIISIALLSIFLQCSSQKNKKMIPTIDSKFERFDIEFFNKNLKKEDTLVRLIEDNSITQFDKQSYGFISRKFYKNNNFTSIKKYFSNYNIKEKVIIFNNGSPVGIWYYFDEKGKLIREENTDEGYGFSPEDVVEYCEKHKIQLPIGYQDSGFQTIVDKREENGKKVWMISHQISGDEIEKLILDGKTGKELSKKIVPFINN